MRIRPYLATPSPAALRPRNIGKTLKLLALSVTLYLTLHSSSIAHAHQPFFEDEDTSVDSPMFVVDPSISTALYGTIDRAGDVDYFAFTALENSRVLVAITIPAIEGQKDFSPTMAVAGPGLPKASLSKSVHLGEHNAHGAIEIRPTPPRFFFEPFSRTSYWSRQREYIQIPRTATYMVAVWHDSKDAVGRYVLVVGEREVRGGDPQFASKIDAYWKPVVPTVRDQTPMPLWLRFLSWVKEFAPSSW